MKAGSTSPGSSRMRWAGPLLALTIGLVFAFAAGELFARVISRTDADGNVVIRSRRLKPYRPPVERVAALVERFRADPGRVVRYDRVLGWSPRPDSASADGMYRYDRHGIRTGQEARRVSVARGPGISRIALFGDSFTASDDVPYEGSIAAHLEAALGGASRAEVLGLGFGGYGLGQAFLRWQQEGARFAPDVVVVGFQAENLKRAVNVVRPLFYWRTGLPFSKPRFVLDDAGELALVNQPCAPPEDVPGILRALPSWELRRHEYFYDPRDYEPTWMRRSRLLAAFEAVLSARGSAARERAFYAPDSSASQLAVRILAEFARSVQATGARFVLFHVPKRTDLERLGADGVLDYAELMERLAQTHAFVETSGALLDLAAKGTLGDLFAPPTGHYSSAANATVARTLASSRYLAAEASR